MDDNNIDENVLSLQQREKRAQIMRRYKAKIERSREMAKTHLAPEKNIKKRAYAQARQIVRTKFAGTRGAEYEKLGPSEKIAIDKAIDKKAALIKKIALKLIPRVKAAEQKRLQSFTKGHALQNHGAPEGGKKVNEAFENIFEAKKAKEEKNAEEKKKNVQIQQFAKFEESVDKALNSKSEKSGIDIDIIKEVYSRGIEAWPEGCKVSQQQYAFARVNSYINQGKTYFNEDSDLHEIAEGYEEDLKHFETNIDKINKEHNRKSDYHYNKAKEYSNAATLNGTTKDLSNLNKARAHQKACKAHADAAGACVMRHHSAFYKSREANKLSDSLNEETQINELSQDTVKSYQKKAVASSNSMLDKDRKIKKDASERKFINRNDGISRASDRLQKEEAKVKPENRELGTDSLTKIYKKDTPGQEVTEENKVKEHNVHYNDGRVEKVRLTDEEAKALKNHPSVAFMRASSKVNEAFNNLARTHTADVKMVKTRNPKTGQAMWRRDKSDQDIVK